MNPEQLLTHFDRISNAPDAIPRLRRFILDLAVRGKLMEQDPRDEPASELLNRIEAEKLKLIKAAKVKRQEPLSPVNEDELPFPVPDGWQPTRLAVVAACLDYMREPMNGTERDQRIAGKNPSELFPYFGATQQQGWIDDYIFDEELVLLGEDGVPFFDDLRPKAYLISGKTWVNNHAHVFRGILVSHAFLTHCLNTFDYKGRVAGATRSKLNQAKAIDIPVILPPLAEQHRIVAKVDELMALCDRLEAAQVERESRRDRLATASLHRLNNGTDPDAFREHARFYFNHLPRLTTRAEHIQQLRQTILNLAVRGKLVTPDLDDRPVRVMGRKEISLSRDYDDHVFNESLSALNLPSSWGVEPLARVVAAIVDCPHSTPKWANKGRICVRTNQFRPGSLDLSESRYVSEETYVDRIQRLEPTHNDILYSREGGILGVACRIPPGVKLCLGQRMMLIRVGEATTAQFLEMVLNSPFITTIARTRTTGGAAPRVNVATIKAYPIPLPPLAEQQRIVAKVDELMALCDRLEAQLTTTHTESRHLLEAVLHEALKPAITQ